MRSFLFSILFLALAAPALGQVTGDSVIVTGGEIKNEPFYLGDQVGTLSWGDTVRVIRDTTVEVSGEEKEYFRISHEGKQGWLDKQSIMDSEERRKYEQDLRMLGTDRVVQGGSLTAKPSSASEKVGEIYWGDTVKVVGVAESYFKISHQGNEGWLKKEGLVRPRERQKYEQKLEAFRDTAVVTGGSMKYKPEKFGSSKAQLSYGDTVKIVGEELFYFRVIRGGQEGWLRKEHVMTERVQRGYEEDVRAKRRRARERKRAKRRKARQRRKYFQSLREKGYTVVLARQTFRKNSADGISVGLGVVNISRSKTIKYLKITWKLFNPVGDPARGQNTGKATAQTRLVGPIEPEGSGYTKFENVWYNSIGTCAEIRGITVEHIDGTTFTYIDDLKDIAQEAESVRLMGDCSYEAQRERKN